MKLEINKYYKVLTGEDVELIPEYDYFICIGEREDYFILHDIEQWASNNNMRDHLDDMEDLEEGLGQPEILDLKYYKKFNSLESVYYKTKQVEVKPSSPKRKFTIV